MKHIRNLALAFLASAALSGCLVMEGKYEKLPPGMWRGTLKLLPEPSKPDISDMPLKEVTKVKMPAVSESELPFNFEVVYENDTVFHIEIINGEERIVVPASDIQFGRSKDRARDTIRIDFPVYESYLTASFAVDVIEGQWVVKTKENYAIPFTAKHGDSHRFTTVRNPPVADLSGKWACTFGLAPDDGEEPYPAVGEFKQTGNLLTGTFLTETGDYRFLEGTVQGNKFYLSCFDGSHAFLFHGKILPDSTLTGAFFSGKHYQTTWDGKRDGNLVLAHPDSLTFLKPGFDKFAFSFQNAAGKTVSLDDPAYQGKAKIIQIMGTWCPNCRDETAFLVEYLNKNKPEGLAVIALAFEKHKDREKANQALRTYQLRMQMPYEVLYAGNSKKEEAALALPMLDRVVAFPTMIFLDKNNRVVRIHTGFSGPATSEYPSFQDNFNKFVAQLLNG